jgi:tetratricopeptide (TPR) repeat protein
MKTRPMIGLCVVLMAAAAAWAAPDDDFGHRMLAAQQLHSQGDFAGAEKILLAALKDADGFAPNDARRAIVLNNLGSVYQFMNRFLEAEQCYRRAVEIEGKLWATVDDKSFRSVLNLAALYIETGQYAKADRLGLRALAADRRTQQNTLDFARLLLLVADLDQHQGWYGKAQEYDEEALAIFEKSAPDGRQTMDTLNNLCVLYRQSGRNADALSRCERALRIAERMDNLEPSMQALLLANVGTLQYLVHGAAEAEPFYAKALTIAESRLGSEHPLLGRILLSYADLLEHTKRKAQAKQCRRRAKAIMEAASTADSNKYTVDLSDLLRRVSHR